MALRARARRRTGARRELALAPAPGLDGGAGPARNGGCRANPKAAEVMSNGTMEETALRLERLIPAPPEVLFAFWTEPAKLLTWWGPDGYEASVHSLDTEPGGRWRITLRRSGTGVRAVS